MRVLSVEGTAWMASAAVFDTESDTVREFHDAYAPDSGGIHPREAAEHMGSAIPGVVADALEYARETPRPTAESGADHTADESSDTSAGGDPYDADTGRVDDDTGIDAVAFSRGPGLGPCLRIVGTAARTVATELDVPLVGVNHMLAHLEIGRHRSGFQRPVCLNASGANAHLLGFHAGRYRVLGETMDTGVGNTLDKFARSQGWSHPGGPKVERHAEDGDYYELPYVVKGMDFSFAGLASAAEDAVADGARVADVCAGLQEHVFGMLTEVSERALSLTGADELVLGGGVAQNERLKAMLREMCEQRGAAFYAPEPRFLRDNAGMIAVLGAKMAAAGDTIAVADSSVDAGFRPDEVPVTWRDEPSVARSSGLRRPESPGGAGESTSDEDRAVRGAEATVTLTDGEVVKRRPPKSYRHPTLDERLRRERTVAEARLLSDARKQGVPTPLVRAVDPETATLRLSFVGDRELGADPTPERVRRVGAHLARLHTAGITHGDPTTRNVRVDDAADGRVYLIDFGLGFHADHVEDLAMDLHVFEGSLRGTVAEPESLIAAFEEAYREERRAAETTRGVAGDETPLERLRVIEGRGRYR